ncbi:MAG: hypothetical protein EXS18_07305 [Verrucomicrobiae bacterium]|nr:hypothetical protein [Verrucomicrobiae bacterium]
MTEFFLVHYRQRRRSDVVCPSQSIKPLPSKDLPSWRDAFGFDANYSVGYWQFWAEFFATDWEVPNIHGDLKAYSYYLETRYKFTPKLYGSLRWGQIFFDGGWDREAWRTEIGFGYYLTRNLLGKIEYEHNDQRGRIQQGANMVSMQLALKL